MTIVHPEFVVDEHENRKAILLSYKEWQMLTEEMEKLADIKVYDKAKAYPFNPLPYSTFDIRC